MERARSVTLWVVSILLAVVYVGLAGYPKVSGAELPALNFREWGYSDAFRVFIGVAEIAGGIGLLIPRLATWAAAGLGLVMLGAIYTHLANAAPGVARPIAFLVVLALVALGRRGQALFLGGGGDSPAA